MREGAKGRADPVEERILRLLMENRGSYVSGQRIADSVGISRTAVWKRVKRLKGRYGDLIESRPSSGYRLKEDYTPLDGLDLLIPPESIIGHPLFIYQEVASTNDIACDLALKGIREGATVVADAQTRGRGRLGREWFSPRGVNLYLSTILRPPIPPWKGPQLVFLGAMAVVRAVEGLGLRVEVKWPNDILVKGRKLSGILTEMSSEPERINFVILGIGVNVNMEEEMLPPELKGRATSLRGETGRVVDRARFAASLIHHLNRYYRLFLDQGSAPILDEWKGYSFLDGREVEVLGPGSVLRGIVLGVDDDGALLLRTSHGVERVISGDVTLKGGLEDRPCYLP